MKESDKSWFVGMFFIGVSLLTQEVSSRIVAFILGAIGVFLSYYLEEKKK